MIVVQCIRETCNISVGQILDSDNVNIINSEQTVKKIIKVG